jgi:hypothetical protein
MMTGLEPDPPAQRSWFGRFRGEEGQARVGVRVGSLEGTHPVLSLMSWVHNECVRIHPFATGNGRIAQVWANWVAMHYGLPPFVRLRPRPSGDGYARAAGAAMSGQVFAMVPAFLDMFLAYPTGGTGSKPS